MNLTKIASRVAQTTLTDSELSALAEKVRNKIKPDSNKEQSQDLDQSGKMLPDSPPDGMVVLLDEEVKTAKLRMALEFKTKNEYEEYKKTHKLNPNTKITILEEEKGKKDDSDVKKKPSKEKPSQKKNPSTEQPSQENKVKTPTVDELSKPGKNDLSIQIAIKDKMVEQFGKEAIGWNGHSVHSSQLTNQVLIRFPDGSLKKYGDLNDAEKKRVQDALEEGRAAHKGLNDYSSVDINTYKKNMANNLSMHENPDVVETKNTSKDKISAGNGAQVARDISDNARSVISKYSKGMSSLARPMLESYVDHVSQYVKEASMDGSLGDVTQEDLDDLVREDIKRLIHQDVETRRRSMGDHGIRHGTQNAINSVSMLEQLQKSGMKITGKDKLMAMTIQANHDNGYTVGEVATDVTKGKKHKEYSEKMVNEELDHYSKVFGEDGASKIKEVIGSHDENRINWQDDAIGSSVRLSDATSLFGREKVQELFISNPKTMELVCRLRLAAEADPSNTQLQDKIKSKLHEAIDSGSYDDIDKDALHSQVNEMNEGKFSSTVDILSRYSGRIQNYTFDAKKGIMNVNMKYSPEGQMVDVLFGDEVSTNKFRGFAGDLNGEIPKGKTAQDTDVVFSSEGKQVVRLHIEDFDKDIEKTAATEAMLEFAKKTARDAIGRARKDVIPPPESSTEGVKKAYKCINEAKDKFDDDEWAKMEDIFERFGDDPDRLMLELKKFPLLKSEREYLESQFHLTASIRGHKIFPLMSRVSSEFVSKRGLQIRRKDKDLMRDTGGVSKGRLREPEIKPSRDDVKNRFRPKRLTKEQLDKDTNKDNDTNKDKDLKISSRHWRRGSNV